MSCDIDLDRVGHDVYGHGVDADEVDDVDDKYSHDRDEPCPVAPLGCTCRSAQSPANLMAMTMIVTMMMTMEILMTISIWMCKRKSQLTIMIFFLW